ncbi:hypothetical protein Tco_0172668 [Tanacetum coccineum]
MTCLLAYEAAIKCSATLLFLSYEFPLLAASSRKPGSQAVPRRLTDRIRQEILTVVSEASVHQVSISMLLSRHFDGGTSSKVKYCFMSDFGNSMGVSWFGFSWCSSYSSASNWTVESAFSSSAMNKCTNALTVSNSLYSFWGRTSGASIEAITLTMDYVSCEEDRGYLSLPNGLPCPNHSLDILVPGQDNAGDALLIYVDSNATPTCTYVPKKLSRDELVELFPEK